MLPLYVPEPGCQAGNIEAPCGPQGRLKRQTKRQGQPSPHPREQVRGKGERVEQAWDIFGYNSTKGVRVDKMFS